MTALRTNTNFLPNLLLNPTGRPHMDGGPSPAMTGRPDDRACYGVIATFSTPSRWWLNRS